MLRTGQWMSEWVSEWVSEWEMYVFHTDQIGSIKTANQIPCFVADACNMIFLFVFHGQNKLENKEPI